jgi:cytochrome c-type biogenesis protein CcmH
MPASTVRTIGLAGGIIGLAAVAAWLGLAHSCEGPRGGVLTGQVSIDPSFADRIRSTDVLFVIVRRPQGPPRPIAVKRIDSPQFPVRFEITGKDVMVQGGELRGMVNVLARVDRDGRAGPAQEGDLEGEFEKNPTLVGGADINIVINKAY